MLNIPALPDRYQTILNRLWVSFRTRRWQWLIGVCAFLIINGYIVYRLAREWHTIATISWNTANPSDLGLALVAHLIGTCTVVAAWGMILRQYGTNIPFRKHFKIYTMANLARKLPGGLGVDLLSRVYMYDQHGSGRLQISFATLIEPIILGVAATIVLAVANLFPGYGSSFLPAIVPVGILVVFLIVLPSPLFRSLLQRIGRALPEEQQLRWPHLLRWVALNTITILLGGVTLFFFCRSFGVIDNTILLLMVQYWALVVVSGTLVAWLPFDIGAMNGITILALASFMPMPQAIAMLVAWRIWLTIIEMLWGGVGLIL